MNKFSKVIALALATTMVLGSTVTAFADEPVTSSTGAGSSEGHVDMKKTNVVLPTSVANTTFGYTMDPEKLIETTSHGKYGDDVVFPTSNDTYVYFNTGTADGKTVYANTSAAVDITNKSSHAINLTVTATAGTTTAATDIPLVAKDAYASAANPSLYLGLKVGSETAVAVAADTPATKTVSIAGTEANFRIAVDEAGTGYEYRVLTLTEWQALNGNSGKLQADYDATWGNTSISLEGGVTTGKAITATTTAPSIAVTWSWVDPEAAPETYVVTYKSNYTDGPEDATENVAANGNPTGPETAFTRTGYTLAGWATTADGEAAALSTLTITEATTLYAIWTEDVKTGTMAIIKPGNYSYFAVKGVNDAAFADGKLTSLVIGGEEFVASTIFYEGSYAVKCTDVRDTAGISLSSGADITATYTVDGEEYTATCTIP